MPVAGLQLCDRSKFTLIATTLPQEGGFGELQNRKFVSCLRCGEVLLCCSGASVSCIESKESSQASFITHT